MSSNESLDALEMTRFVIQKVMTPPVAAFGLAGNVLNIAVLTRPSMRSSSTNCYLTGLAIYDMLYLALVLLMSLGHYESLACSDFYFVAKHKFIRPITDISSNTGVWLTLTFTVERYIGVCHPIRGKVWCTAKRARYVITAVCVMAAAITTPEFFEKKVIPRDLGEEGNVDSRMSNPFISSPPMTDTVGRTLALYSGFDQHDQQQQHRHEHHHHHHHHQQQQHHQRHPIRRRRHHHCIHESHDHHEPQQQQQYRCRVPPQNETKARSKKMSSNETEANFEMQTATIYPSTATFTSSSSSSSSPSSSSSSSPSTTLFKSRVCLDKSRTLKVIRTDFGRSTAYSLVYLYGNQVLFTFLPLLLLMIFNHLLVRQVIVADRERRKMTPHALSISNQLRNRSRREEASSHVTDVFALREVKATPCGRTNPAVRRSSGHQLKDQQRITIMLITLVILFILCQLPQSLQNLYRVYRSISGTLTEESMRLMLITGNIFNFLVVINCGSNFILYSLLSTRFRATFARMCCTKLRR